MIYQSLPDNRQRDSANNQATVIWKKKHESRNTFWWVPDRDAVIQLHGVCNAFRHGPGSIDSDIIEARQR
jgi:hypothetical protein